MRACANRLIDSIRLALLKVLIMLENNDYHDDHHHESFYYKQMAKRKYRELCLPC